MDFDRWMNKQTAAAPEPAPEAEVRLTCAGCGKSWSALRSRVDNGDECAFVLADEGDELEVYCGGSIHCAP